MRTGKWSTWKIVCNLNYCDPPREEIFTMNSQGIPNVQRMKDELISQKPNLERFIYSFKYLSHQKTS